MVIGFWLLVIGFSNVLECTASLPPHLIFEFPYSLISLYSYILRPSGQLQRQKGRNIRGIYIPPEKIGGHFFIILWN